MNWRITVDNTYWQKQTKEKPLFPELEWSRPENRKYAGKLLIIGGNKYGMSAPAAAYQQAEKAGAGMTRVLIPDAVKPLLVRLHGHTLETEFAPSTPSGSFSQKALAEWLDMAHWADGVLLPGDLGRNSETAITLEKFLTKYSGQVTLAHDAVDIAFNIPRLLERPQTTFVTTMADLQKLNALTNSTRPVTLGMDLLKLIELLHWLTQHYPIHIIVKHQDKLCVAVAGQVSTTQLEGENVPTDPWRTQTATHAAVWWLQNPAKPFEALTVSIA